MDKEIAISAPNPNGKGHMRLEWCDVHWTDMTTKLLQRGLQGSYDVGYDMNPLQEANLRVTHAALQMFGPHVIVHQHAGCPVCAFQHINEHVADHLAMKYKEPQ